MQELQAIAVNPSRRFPVTDDERAAALRLARTVRSPRLRQHLAPLAAQRRWTAHASMVVRLLHIDGDCCHLCRGPLGGVPQRDGALMELWPWKYKMPTLDHLIPEAYPGSTFDEDNLRLAHQLCNSARGCEPLADDLVAPSGWASLGLSMRPLRYPWSAHNAVSLALRPARLLVQMPTRRVPLTTVMRGAVGDRVLDALARTYELRAGAERGGRLSTFARQAIDRVESHNDEVQFAEQLAKAIEPYQTVVMRTVQCVIKREARLRLREPAAHALALA